MASGRPPFATPLCALLGVEHQIVQSGMSGIAGPKVVVEVSNAGGLGIVAALRRTKEQLRDLIREIAPAPANLSA